MKYIATFSSNIQKNMEMGFNIRFCRIEEFNVNMHLLIIAPLIQNALFRILFYNVPAIEFNFMKIKISYAGLICII
jgi:hypothetical protein